MTELLKAKLNLLAKLKAKDAFSTTAEEIEMLKLLESDPEVVKFKLLHTY